ncbi:MAG: hypothetical protein NDJ94_05565 [Vicinamibacteria bacterium]|nr:hypothetical protein [Vicinamibacteria bacterium]
MPRSTLLTIVSLVLPALAAAQAPLGSPVATLVYVEGAANITPASGVAAPATQGQKLRTGERLQTDAAFVRLEFPWMKASLAPQSAIHVPAETILSVVLEAGRLEIFSEEDTIKVVTPEAEVRGRGRAILRRTEGMTRVMVIDGQVAIETEQGGVALNARQGALVATGGAIDGPHPLPAAPRDVQPTADPQYLPVGTSVDLVWQGDAERYYVEMLAVDVEESVFATETGKAPYTLALPWIGTYRWRVTAIDPRGLESAPSVEGTVCVIDPDAGKGEG